MLLIVVDDRLTENSQGQKLQLPIPLEADTVHSTRCFMLVSVRKRCLAFVTHVACSSGHWRLDPRCEQVEQVLLFETWRQLNDSLAISGCFSWTGREAEVGNSFISTLFQPHGHFVLGL